MKEKIIPAIWFDQKAKDAADFYTEAFTEAALISDGGISFEFSIYGFKFLGINGGPMYKPNPSISFFVECDSLEELDHAYKILTEGGMVMMALDAYPWSEKYAFIQDKFGVSWQLTLRGEGNTNPKIMPSLLFVNDNNGKAEEAVKLYTSIFKHAEQQQMTYYGVEGQNTEGNVMYSRSEIEGLPFVAMDGPGDHKFTFDEGVSLMVVTVDQVETDYLWDALTANGGKEIQCGWLSDPYGVVWQIVPKRFLELVSSGDEEAKKRVFAAMMPMKKLIISELEKAAIN